MFLLFAFLICFISVSLTPIPPNCTLTHNHVRSRGTVPPMWLCPEGSPSIWRQQMCDKFFNCRQSLGDEKICVDYGPLGSSNLTFMEDKIPVGPSSKPVVPRMYLPDLDCSAPLCVNGPYDIDLGFKAHLICRQMARDTYQWWAVVDNDKERWPVAFSPQAVQCAGHEETIQQCAAFHSMKTPLLVGNCTKLLALSCAKECIKEVIIDDDSAGANGSSQALSLEEGVFLALSKGILTSPGYPNYFLPHLDCTWKLRLANKRRLLVINVTVLNLQEFDVRSSQAIAEGDDQVCLNSYVEIGLGMHSNGSYAKRRVCRESSVGESFIAFGNRIYIRYFAGQYLGSVVAPKGFALTYYTIDSGEDNSDVLTSPMIILISFITISVFILLIVVGLYAFSKSQFRRDVLASRRRHEMIGRVKKQRALPMMSAPTADGEFEPPVICTACYRRVHRITELCAHYARLLQFVTGNDYTAFIKPPTTAERLAEARRRRRQLSFTSNITIDLDDLLKTDTEFNHGRQWHSMDDISSKYLESLRTALNCDTITGTPFSQTVQLDSSFLVTDVDEDMDNAFLTPFSKRTPKMVAKQAASAVSNFLTSAVSHTNRLSIPSWRTPSPGQASTPKLKQRQEIAVKEGQDDQNDVCDQQSIMSPAKN